MTSLVPSPTLFTTPPSLPGRYSAVAAGPGLGTADPTARGLAALLKAVAENDLPLLLDADALNLCAAHPDLLNALPQSTIITPHEGEYRRLFGTADPAAMARQHHLVIVAKSHRTHIFGPDGQQATNTTGNPGMATAGSGDVLTGIILGLLAQGVEPFEAAQTGVFLHGKSGDIATQKQSQSSLIASDLVKNLQYIFN